MQTVIYVLVEAFAWIGIFGTVLNYVVPCPEVFSGANPILWPVLLGCAASLILRPVFRGMVTLVKNFRTVYRATYAVPKSKEDVAFIGIENAVDFCWYMSEIQVVEFSRVFGDPVLFMQTDGEFGAQSNRLFFQLFGRHPIAPPNDFNGDVTILRNGTPFFCKDMSECWVIVLACEAANILGKRAEEITQQEIEKCLSKSFVQRNKIGQAFRTANTSSR